MNDYPFTVCPARYAKGQMAVHCQSNGMGTKTRAMRLCCAFKARWTNREHAYILSPTKTAKLQSLYDAGWDAGIFGDLIEPGNVWNELLIND